MQNRPVNTPTIEPSSQRGFAESWGVGALIAVVVAGFCGICIYVLIDLRRAEWDQARLAATNLVTAIQTDIARNVELYDLSLQGVAENFDEPELAHVSARTRNLILFNRAANSKFMGPILVLDQDGRVIAELDEAQPEFGSRMRTPTISWSISRTRSKAFTSATWILTARETT